MTPKTSIFQTVSGKVLVLKSQVFRLAGIIQQIKKSLLIDKIAYNIKMDNAESRINSLFFTHTTCEIKRCYENITQVTSYS